MTRCALKECEFHREPLPLYCLKHWQLIPSEIQTRVLLAMSRREESEAGTLEWVAAIGAAREALTIALTDRQVT